MNQTNARERLMLSPAISRRSDETPYVVVILPAHNEEDHIVDAIRALQTQTSPPDLIIVSADNCTDDTVNLARTAGAEVFVTEGNVHKRAGAVNQPLQWLLPYLKDHDIVAMVDADTKLDAGFLENAERLLKRRYDAVGPTFDVEPTWSLITQLQNNEYARYSRITRRRGGKTLNLSGAAQTLKVKVIREVVAARVRGDLPGEDAMYNTDAISEDMELTIAVKTLGFRAMASSRCRCVTDMMPTIKDLWVQRIRWIQGGMVELRRYGYTKITKPMIVRQYLSGFNVLFTLAWIAYSIYLTSILGWQRFDYSSQPLWALVTLFFAGERAFTARKAGWRGSLVAALLVPELLYELFRQTVFVISLTRHLRRVEIRWA